MIKDSILLLADSPILNPKEIVPYYNLSTNYSVYLNTLLFSNWIDLLSESDNQVELFTLLNERDKEYLPKYLLPTGANSVFYKEDIDVNLTEIIYNHSSHLDSKTIIVYFNSIGLKLNEIFRAFSLVTTDEPSLVIGKSDSHKINCVCAKNIESELFSLLIKSKRCYDKYLGLISYKDYFLHPIRNFLSIDEFEDIKKLYIELSKKESLSYCSQKMHESFNDLFIEYKELLNV